MITLVVVYVNVQQGKAVMFPFGLEGMVVWLYPISSKTFIGVFMFIYFSQWLM